MSTRPFSGRVALVTGGGRGLGRAYALELARLGARVVVNDLGSGMHGSGADLRPAADVVREIVSAGGCAVADNNTVATAEGAQAMVRTAVEEYGPVDIVINNAGIVRNALFRKTTELEFRAVHDVHVLGTFHVSRAAWDHMRAQGYGRILNTASNVGLLGTPAAVSYGTAKAAILGLTRVLALEGAQDGIRVNAIAPIAASRMTEDLPLDGWSAELFDPALVAPVAAWLVHEDCSSTGEVYTAGGGRVARYVVAMTEGFYDPDLTFDAVRRNAELINDATDPRFPETPGDEFAILRELAAR